MHKCKHQCWVKKVKKKTFFPSLSLTPPSPPLHLPSDATAAEAHGRTRTTANGCAGRQEVAPWWIPTLEATGVTTGLRGPSPWQLAIGVGGRGEGRGKGGTARRASEPQSREKNKTKKKKTSQFRSPSVPKFTREKCQFKKEMHPARLLIDTYCDTAIISSESSRIW